MNRTISLNNNFKNKLVSFESDSLKPSREIIGALNEITDLQGVSNIVLFQDFHLKNKYLQADYKASVPSSVAIQSDVNSLYPQLRSRGIGCGMILISTGIIVDDIKKTRKKLNKFLPCYLSINKPVYPKGVEKTRNSFYISVQDNREMSLQGAPWIHEHFGLNKNVLKHFYRNGSFFSKDELKNFSWDGLSEKWRAGKERNGKEVGLDLTGNHFLEAQIVDTIPSNITETDLKKNELVFLYHGSCNGLKQILDTSIVKDLIEQPDYKKFQKTDWEYDLILKSTKILLNWSAASRCLVIARLQSLLKKMYPHLNLNKIKCISESPHNMILENEKGLLYRHNVHPHKEKRMTIISGRNDHTSYLCVPGPLSKQFLNSIDHGVGAILKNRIDSDTTQSKKISNLISIKKKNNLLFSKKISTYNLIDQTAVKTSFLNTYEKKGLIEKNIIALQPIVTLKKNTNIYPMWLKTLRKILK